MTMWGQSKKAAFCKPRREAQEKPSCLHSRVARLSSRTVRKQIAAAEATWSVLFCSGSPSKLIQLTPFRRQWRLGQGRKEINECLAHGCRIFVVVMPSVNIFLFVPSCGLYSISSFYWAPPHPIHPDTEEGARLLHKPNPVWTWLICG